ncbi:HNH endonuclease [Clostridium perfringens]|uniref:HNH endonuclease n=1 Tax=Clostridium perfringens TaxID=1502 RepID=UPI000F52A9AF|nr:HNH endonuclease signature motif containing protein [Clostridium perfringens]
MRGNLVYNNIDLNTENKKELSLEKIAFKKYRNNTCQFCGKTIKKWAEKTVDHAVPVARGGIDAPSNWRIACSSCNAEKGMMTEVEYKEFKKITSNWKPFSKNFAREKINQWLSNYTEIKWDKLRRKVIERIIEEIEVIKGENLITEERDKLILSDEVLNYNKNNEEFIRADKILICENFENTFERTIHPEQKKVNDILERYKRYGTISNIKLYKGILLPCSIHYFYAYYKILRIKELPVINIKDSSILTKKEIAFINSCKF